MPGGFFHVGPFDGEVLHLQGDVPGLPRSGDALFTA